MVVHVMMDTEDTPVTKKMIQIVDHTAHGIQKNQNAHANGAGLAHDAKRNAAHVIHSIAEIMVLVIRILRSAFVSPDGVVSTVVYLILFRRELSLLAFLHFQKKLLLLHLQLLLHSTSRLGIGDIGFYSFLELRRHLRWRSAVGYATKITARIFLEQFFKFSSCITIPITPNYIHIHKVSYLLIST